MSRARSLQRMLCGMPAAFGALQAAPSKAAAPDCVRLLWTHPLMLKRARSAGQDHTPQRLGKQPTHEIPGQQEPIHGSDWMPSCGHHPNPLRPALTAAADTRAAGQVLCHSDWIQGAQTRGRYTVLGMWPQQTISNLLGTPGVLGAAHTGQHKESHMVPSTSSHAQRESCHALSLL